MQQVAYKYPNMWQEQLELPVAAPQVKSAANAKSINKNRYRQVIVKCGVCLFAYAALLVFLCAKSASLGYEIERLNKDITQLANANQRLEYEIASYSSLSRIEMIAATELGMQKADLNNSIAVEVKSQPIQVAASQPEIVNLSEKPLHKIYASLAHLAQNSL